MQKFLNDLLNYHEITTCDKEKKAYVDAAHRPTSYEVDWNLVNSLIHCDILDIDSGNWETGERHYTLDEKYYELSKLEKIVELKQIITNWFYHNSNYQKLLEEFLILEKTEERKCKIKKIENESKILCT